MPLHSSIVQQDDGEGETDVCWSDGNDCDSGHCCGRRESARNKARRVTFVTEIPCF